MNRGRGTVIAIFEEEAEVHGHGEFHQAKEMFLHPFSAVPACYPKAALYCMGCTLRTARLRLMRISSLRESPLSNSLYSVMS